MSTQTEQGPFEATDTPQSLTTDASNMSSAGTSTEPRTPEHQGPPARRSTKSRLDELIEIGHWYANMEGAGGAVSYTRIQKKPKKTLEQQMLEDQQQEAALRKQKREASRIKREAELAKKREEEARINEEKRLERERLKQLKRKEAAAATAAATAAAKSKAKKRKPSPAVKNNNPKTSTPKSDPSPSPETDILQKRSQKKERLVDNYFPFLNVRDDVEIPIRSDFFVKEVYGNTVRSIRSLKFKPAAELVKESPKKYKNYKGLEPKVISLKSVIYPNVSEDYYLLASQDLQLDPLEEIGRLIELTSLVFFPDEYKLSVYNPQDPYNSIAGRYSKAFFAKDYETALKIIDEFNDLITLIHSKDGFTKHLQEKKTISRLVLHEFLNQFYSRSVSPQVSSLKGYRAFSNNVYGELMPKFLSKVFDQVGLSSSSTFIDLGSGVGNVTIQAALEYGCESYGCEMMENCSILGDLHAIAFEERCKLYGLNPGKVGLFNHQSFVDNKDVKAVVDKCDVILVNNFLFTADLNKEVMKLFSNLKPGTKIISLKGIIPDSHFIDFNDVDNYMNKFEVTKYEFGDSSVSWTSKGGHFFVTEYTGLISERALTVFNTRSRDRKVHRN